MQSFSRIKYKNQSTSNWKIGQHKRGLTKRVKAYNQGFPYATVRYDGLLPGGGGVLDQWLGIGVPMRVSNPDPV